MNQQNAISKKSLFLYGFLALPVAFAGFPLYVLAPDFYATRYGLSLTLLGTLLLVIRLFDAVQDPIIGWLTDRLRGRFLPFIATSGALLCLSVFGLFNVVVLTPAIWFSLCMLLAVSAYSVLVIMLGAQATLWTKDRNDQTRIAGAREGFGLIGLVIAVSMPTLLAHVVHPDKIYVWYAVILSGLMVAGVMGFASVSKATENMMSLKTQMPPVFSWRFLTPETRKLLAVYALSMLASSIPAVLVIFYVRDLLGAEHLTGPFLLLYFLSGAAAMPLWKKASARFGKYKAWAFANALAVIGFVGAFFLGAGDVAAYAVVCVASGFALGADLTLPPSILADHIHARGNTAFSGTYYACLAFIGKASLALASAIVLPVLDASGFKPQAVNSSEALLALSTTYALIPCFLKLMAAYLLYTFYSGEKHETI